MSTTPGSPDPDDRDPQRDVPLPPEAREEERADAATDAERREAERDADRRETEREAERDADRREAEREARDEQVVPVAARRGASAGLLRIVAIIVIIGGVISIVAGAITWAMVRSELRDEQITVSDDADRFAGDRVEGPFTAYEQAKVIERHALEESDGLTYAQLDRDDPRRDQAMNASFLRASLFTSVVAFGIAAFAVGLGILLILVGVGLFRTANALRSTLTA